MNKRIKTLVVCSRNKKRSLTAETVFSNDQRVDVRSVGTSKNAKRTINLKDIDWADVILCMENKHKEMIQDMFGRNNLPRIKVLNIEDEYEYMDSELVEMLKLELKEIILFIPLS